MKLVCGPGRPSGRPVDVPPPDCPPGSPAVNHPGVPRQNTATSRAEVPSGSLCPIVVTTTDADTRLLLLDMLPADCARAAAPQPNTAARATRGHVTRRITDSLRRFAR